MAERTTKFANGFDLIGPSVEFGDVAISPEEAEVFLLAASKGAKLARHDNGDTEIHVQRLSATDGLLSDASGDYEVSSLSYFSKTSFSLDLDYWRSVITFARYNAKDRNTKIYNAYEVQQFGGEVTVAVRRIRVIRDLSRMAFDGNGEPFEDIYSRQRKQYEVPITSEDILAVDQLVERTTGRSLTTGGH